jgi:cobalamin transport system ATP-binding protein
MLLLDDVHFSYEDEVIRGVTLGVARGEVVALLGPNGAGKSTLLAIACGMLVATRGKALVNGRDVTKLSRREAAQKIALVAQTSEVRFPLTSLEYVLAGRYAHVSAIGFDRPLDLNIAVESLKATDASQFSARRFDELSSGERRRIVLARALAQQPELLLLDEPTANVDISHQLSLLSLVRKLAVDRALAVLFVTHEINLAAEFADRIALLKGGRLVAFGDPGEVMTEPLLTECFDTPLLVDRHPVSGNPRISYLRN